MPDGEFKGAKIVSRTWTALFYLLAWGVGAAILSNVLGDRPYIFTGAVLLALAYSVFTARGRFSTVPGLVVYAVMAAFVFEFIREISSALAPWE